MSSLAILFLMTSQAFKLPPGLLSSVCYVESGHSPSAVSLDDGGSSSVGVCQIKVGSARRVDFKGTAKQLQDPATNVYFSAALLRHLLNRYHGDVRKAVLAYNAGSYRVNAKGKAINSHYAEKVFKAWAEGR